MGRRLTTTVIALLIGLHVLVPLSPTKVFAEGGLSFSQLKVTSSGQFVTLFNPTSSTVDMNKVKLEYFNHYDPAQATSGKLIALDGGLTAQGYYIVSDDSLNMCFAALVASASLGFSTTSGSLRIINFNSSAVGVIEETISWVNKNPVSGVQTMPASPGFLHRQTGSSVWQAVQPSPSDPCQLVSAVQPAETVPTNPGNQLLPGTAPQATFVYGASSTGGGPGMPAGNTGLQSPVVTEALPNPDSPQTDSADEFVELYNPNDKTFELSGFKIQTASTGSSSQHVYTIPNGTTIAAKGFITFTSGNTSISLNNSGGQVWLLDPFGNVLSNTDVYGTAKEGQSWSLADGKWYWTSSPTPGKANIINQTATAASGSTKNQTVGVVQGASTGGGSSQSATGSQNGEAPQQIHASVLAIISVLALLYGAYEYRHDIANRIYQFKRYRETRRTNRQAAKG